MEKAVKNMAKFFIGRKQYLSILNSMAFILIFSLAAIGCSGQAAYVREPLPDIIWPKPPEVPRIMFVNSISRPEHLRIEEGALKGILKYFSGKVETSIVSPHGVEVDSEGRLYVVDTLLKKIHVFDVQGNKYYTFPKNGKALISPIDLAIDNKRGFIFVTDSHEAVISIFKKDGAEYVGEIKKGEIGRPTGIAVNEITDELLVVDTMHSTIIRSDLAGHLIKAAIGREGEAEGRFHSPAHISVSRDGYILVSDSLNFRVQMFSPAGEYMMKFGSAGDSPGYFSRPKGVAVDSDGNIYVVDGLFDNVQMFNKEGKLLMAFGNPGNYYGEFWLPTGIYIDKNDYIYISDTFNNRVQVFKYMKGDDL